MDEMRESSRCEILQLIENFSKDKNRTDGLHSQCKTCRKICISKNFDEIKINSEQNKTNEEKPMLIFV